MSETCKVSAERRGDVAILWTDGYINNQGGEEIAREAYKWLAPYWNETIDPAVLERLLKNAAEKYNKPLESVDRVLDMRFYEEALKAV